MRHTPRPGRSASPAPPAAGSPAHPAPARPAGWPAVSAASRSAGAPGPAHPRAPDALGAVPAAPTARAPLMRKVEFAWAVPGGGFGEGSRLVPALPAFEEAFAAFARGTLLATSRGLVGVEDLLPGMEVRVAGGAMRPLLWRGSTVVVPMSSGTGSARVDPAMTRLTRISADALGVARPAENLVLGPHARVVRRGPAVRALAGAEAALVPASDLADGDGVTTLSPASPVPVFHLGFERHERLDAHGLEVGSQHPGSLVAAGLSAELLELWLSCFPHRRALADWGPAALPRLSGQDLALFDAA